MVGKKKAKEIVKKALAHCQADQIEVSLFNYDQALTRFANNYIHQNVNEANSIISIRVVFGKKIGAASTNSLEVKKIKSTVEWAERIARRQRENPDFVSLPAVRKNAYRTLTTYSKKTAGFSNMDRAEAVSRIIAVAKEHSLTAYGSVSNGSSEICVGNSLGTFAYGQSDDVFCNIVMSGENSTGYAQGGMRDISQLDFAGIARKAARKAILSDKPHTLAPGSYTTIFEPLAASEFLTFLSYYAFNGKMYEEGRSYLSGKLNNKIVDENITVVDDPFNRRGYPFAFDMEGVPKRSLVLVDKGVAKNVVYDSLTAGRSGKKSTGHALTAPNPFGPIPLNIVMKGGKDTLDGLLRNTSKGILVTRFHYTNMIDPHKLVFTGMTRDGTFLIENGVIVHGIKNFRFTENIIDCFNRIDGISRTCDVVAFEPGYGGRFGRGIIVPTLKIRDFGFTSATEF